MVVFKINNTDYSSHVIAEGYDVCSEDEYEVWTDGAGYENRKTYRTRVTGTFDMLFHDIDDYEAFTDTLAANKATNGTYPITVVDNATNAEVSINAFIKFRGVRGRNDLWEDFIERFTVEIRER